MSSDAGPTSGSSPADALAALGDGPRNTKRADRPRRTRLDAGISVELPAPRVLARVFALPTLTAAADVFADGAALVRRPHGASIAPQPSPFPIVVDELRAALEALPHRDDAGRQYRDLRIYMLDGRPDAVADYLTETVRAVRIAAPAWRASAERQERRPALTVSERQRVSRERRRLAESGSAEYWLTLWLAEVVPGTRIAAPALHELACEGIAAWVDDHQDDPEAWAKDGEDGGLAVPAVPGARTFYAVADARLGPRQRGAQGVRVYVVSTVAAELADRVQQLHDREGWKAA